jgi:hypothetical protein
MRVTGSPRAPSLVNAGVRRANAIGAAVTCPIKIHAATAAAVPMAPLTDGMSVSKNSRRRAHPAKQHSAAIRAAFLNNLQSRIFRAPKMVD